MRTLLLAATLACGAAAGGALAADGALDPGFVTDAEYPGFGFYVNPNGTPNFSLDRVGAVLPAADNKIWVVGRMRAPGGYRLSLYRVQADGYPDVEFGSLGLRTVIGPCADFNAADAVVDSQGRIVVAIYGCADFMVYRFLPNGDLDASLAGSGVLTVPFNQGGSNEDFGFEVATTANDGIVVAGSVATASTTKLGIAHFTSAGLPVPGFGVAGKVQLEFEWSVSDIIGVNELAVTADGRIVAIGQISQTSQAVSDKKQFVVRLLANGAMDPSFGNTSPGISKVNLRSPLGLTESPRTYGALMERDGSVIQVGRVVSNQVNSAGDILLLRWRPDGQLDTNIGPSGVRQYALDFAGPNPSDPTLNSDSADSIARQGDGKYVLVGGAYKGEYYATTVLRLKKNFAIDTSFGTGGKIQHLAEVSTTGDHGQTAEPILLRPGRIVVGGTVFTGVNGRMQMMFGMQNDLLFADGVD
jgi:uncharacterized delta-60 repeat protein